MNKDFQTTPDASQLQEAAKELARRATDAAGETANRATIAAKDVTGAVKHAATDISDAAKEMYQSAAVKAEDTLSTSKQYIRENPILVVAGALALGAAIGCLLVMGRRQPTFRQRCVDEPLGSAREAILAAIAPVAQRLHDGYDSARDGAGKAMDRVHRFNAGRTVDSLTGQIGLAGSNLKFW